MRILLDKIKSILKTNREIKLSVLTSSLVFYLIQVVIPFVYLVSNILEDFEVKRFSILNVLSILYLIWVISKIIHIVYQITDLIYYNVEVRNHFNLRIYSILYMLIIIVVTLILAILFKDLIIRENNKSFKILEIVIPYSWLSFVYFLSYKKLVPTKVDWKNSLKVALFTGFLCYILIFVVRNQIINFLLLKYQNLYGSFAYIISWMIFLYIGCYIYLSGIVYQFLNEKYQQKNIAYNNYGQERGVIINKVKKLMIVAMFLFTLLFTSTKVFVQASGWGFSRNSRHHIPEIGKYKDIIKDTNSFYTGDASSVYLTFDAGYDNGMMDSILDTLKDKDVKASFFLTGDFVKRFPRLTLRISKEGHAACNHSYSHRRITSLSNEALKSDIQKLEDEYYKLTHQEMLKCFRPPEGEFNRFSLMNLNELGYKTIFWSIAYVDWKTDSQLGADHCVKTIMNNLHDGAIILMHSVSSSNKEALPTIIDEIRKEGYSFKTVNEL